ncbi:MAG: protein kinase [Desulfarculaceae bacterium]|nr:protein kinase [Desulfarculaceae bacterium]
MKTIGKYTVLGFLGRGGMSRVYKVRHDIGPVRALKLFAPRAELATLLPGDELRARFLDEAATLAELKHPRLVRVHQVHPHEPAFYVMDHYCLSLAEVIGEGARLEDPTRPLGVEQALAWGAQALEGLSVLHRAGVVHRDLKPANLMLGDDETVRLGDLGLSHRHGELSSGRPNLVLGSPAYAAPELERDPLGVDPRADLYSLGVSLFRLLTGHLPEEGRAASVLRLELDVAWDAFFDTALADKPDGRFVDAQAMASALHELFVAWEARREAACALIEPTPAPDSAPEGQPRSEPLRVRLAEARDAFGLDGLMRPQQWLPRDLAQAGPGVLHDAASGLFWQKGGSPQPLTHEQAAGYVQALNLRRLGGRNGWRLPTVAELATLLAPPPAPGQDCAPPIMDPLQDRLWSADTATPCAAWYANLAAGYLGRADKDCFLFVRAVRA